MKANLVLGGLLSAALIAGGYWAGVANVPNPHAHAAPPAAQSAPAVQAPAAMQTLPDFSTIVEGNKAAVVNITSTMKAQASAAAPEGLDEDSPFYDFFRRCQVPGPQMPRQGMGSGFIVQPDGVILTNAHVVEGADEVRVRLADRHEYKGKVLGSDHQSDIA